MRKNVDISKLHNANELLNSKYGEEGTSSREEFNKESISFYYGEILKSRRKELQLTQEDLAEKIGVNRSYIARIEKGKTDMQLSSLIRIAQVLGMKFSLN